MYSDKVMDHFTNPRNVGEIENADGVGEVGNASCGDIMRISLQVEDDVIKDVKFKTFGCGAAIATSSMATEMIKDKTLEEAEKVLSNIPNIKLMEADVLDLPFMDETFDLVVFTVVLIYIKDQQKALNEMARVTKKGGIVIATSEPDYASYISYPEDPIAPLVTKNMEYLGADTLTGRKLKFLFANAGLKTEVGIETAGDYIIIKDDTKLLDMFHEQFWVVEKIFKRFDWTEEEIEQYRTEMEKRKKMGTQFAFMPSFYAIGKKV